MVIFNLSENVNVYERSCFDHVSANIMQPQFLHGLRDGPGSRWERAALQGRSARACSRLHQPVLPVYQTVNHVTRYITSPSTTSLSNGKPRD